MGYHLLKESLTPKRTSKPLPHLSKRLTLFSWLNGRGHRYYSCTMGRWISRDPAEEMMGVALYLSMHNAMLDSIDPLGECTLKPDPLDYAALEINVADAEPDDKSGSGFTDFYYDFECHPSCSGKGGCEVRCSITVHKVSITISPSKNKLPYYKEGVLGHEQLHVWNYIRYILKLKEAVGLCESINKNGNSPNEAKQRADWMNGNHSHVWGQFKDNETTHKNFQYPDASTRYWPFNYSGIKGDKTNIIKEYPKVNPVYKPGPFDPATVGYHEPNPLDLCGKAPF